jgi:hypothetical protein
MKAFGYVAVGAALLSLLALSLAWWPRFRELRASSTCARAVECGACCSAEGATESFTEPNGACGCRLTSNDSWLAGPVVATAPELVAHAPAVRPAPRPAPRALLVHCMLADGVCTEVPVEPSSDVPGWPPEMLSAYRAPADPDRCGGGGGVFSEGPCPRARALALCMRPSGYTEVVYEDNRFDLDAAAVQAACVGTAPAGRFESGAAVGVASPP